MFLQAFIYSNARFDAYGGNDFYSWLAMLKYLFIHAAAIG